MNQILISEKLYITPELRRKKKMYKILFIKKLPSKNAKGKTLTAI